MVEYSRGGFHDCVGGRRVVFVGDSTVRQIYWAAATRLDHMKAHVALLDVFVDDSKHDNLYFEAEGVKLEFIWDPWLNSSGLHSELTSFRAQETFADVGSIKSKDEESAALIIVGSPGLWAARHGGDEYLNIFKRGIESIRIHISSNLDDHLFFPTKDLRRNYIESPNQILLAPVSVPSYNLLSHDRAVTITPEKVEKMNQYLAGLPPDEQTHMLWAYNKMTRDIPGTYEVNGIHVVDRVAERKIDLALNARCNAAKGHQIPHEASCCMVYPERHWLPELVAIVAALVLFWRCWKSLRAGRSQPPRSVYEVIAGQNKAQAAVYFIPMIIAYCDHADRSHKFTKLNRHYDTSTFLATCAVFWLFSLLSWRSSSRSGSLPVARPTKARFEPALQNDKGFLSREQSNEWKGWMQAMILLYHYHHASQTLWVYKVIRLLISGYIFLSGYGHTTYLLRTGDFSLRRTAAIIFRLNLLSALLPYMMGTDYNFYYFAPIITFWYLVVHLTLGVLRRYNQDPVLLLGKIVVAAIATSCFILIPQPLQLVSTICRRVFHMSWDSNELRFRLTVDRYIVFFGMFTASIVHRMDVIRSSQSIFDSQQSIAVQSNCPSRIDPALSVLVFPDALTKPVKPLACAFSALFILFFTIITQTQVHDKTQYNIAHPYMSWIPVLSFLVIRNSYKWLRNSHLALPAALGEISLETYVLQYHIWLGNDATAKLGFGLWGRYGGLTWLAGPGRYLELLLISGTFICVSAYGRWATDVLTRWLFYPDSHAVPNGLTRDQSDGEPKGRSSEDVIRRLSLNSLGHHEKDTLHETRHNRPVRFGSLGQVVRQDVRFKTIVIFATLWVANLLYV